MRMKPWGNRVIFVLAVLVLFGMVLAGCLGERPDREKAAREHTRILHPPHYEWDTENKTLGGYFILSNIHPDHDNETMIAMSQGELWIRASFRFDEEDEDGRKISGWTHRYDSLQQVDIKPGESVVFNFTFPKQSRSEVITKDPVHIAVTMGLRYVFCCDEKWAVSPHNENGRLIVGGMYANRCMAVENGEIVQKYSGGFFDGTWIPERNGCNPWREVNEPRGGFYQRIGSVGDRLYFPPPEVWAQWDDSKDPPLSRYPYLEPAVEFLREFDLESANVRYFDGRIT